ncbi:hypothetical protein ACIOMM_36215, partial [Streptomyces sp. NPDC087908]|uniref:hypothetical protein n=1 Tax=Streptomyces sp. NPDC087908 TaxID=3365820 RepID=UPI0038075458
MIQSFGSPSHKASQEEAEEGIARFEEYLLVQRIKEETERAASSFAGQLSWLGPAERAEVARRYASSHFSQQQQMLCENFARIRQIRAEFSQRYHTLRQRLAVLTACFIVMALCLIPLAFR